MSRKRICLVTSEIAGPFRNGGIGTHCYYLTKFLGGLSDWETTIVYNGAIDKHDNSYWVQFFHEKYGAKFAWVRPGDVQSYTQWQAPTCLWDQISQLNYEFLKKHPQDLVIFQEMLGGGFRSIQAKRSLGCFANTELVVMVHSSWEWVNQSMGCLPAYGLPEMTTKFMERYSVQYCDELVSPSRYMLEWSKTDVPSLPERTRVLPYLFEKEVDKVRTQDSADEIIFFGRLEQRKGLVLFLHALAQIASKQCCADRGSRVVYFLGKAGRTEDGDGLATIEKFRPKLAGAFELRVEDDLGHEEALEFLRSHPSALVVCPSLQDNSPYAVIENLELGTNLIACATGGIPELFSSDERLCRPEPQALSALIQCGLDGKLPPINSAYSKQNARVIWGEFLESKRGAGTDASRRKAALPIKFIVMGGSRGDRLAKQLGSSFTDPLAILDGESSESHVLIINEKAKLSEDAPETLAECVVSDPFTIWTGFTSIGHSSRTLYAPLGGCGEAALFGNVFGVAAALIPRDYLRDRGSGCLRLLEMAVREPEYFWPLLASFSLESGRTIDVVPKIIAELSEEFSCEFSQSPLALKLEVIKVCESSAPKSFSRMFQYFAASADSCSPDRGDFAKKIFALGDAKSTAVAIHKKLLFISQRVRRFALGLN